MPGTENPLPDRESSLRAIGSLLWKDPEVVLGVVAGLRDSDTVIECAIRGASMGASIPAGAALRVRVGRMPPLEVGQAIAFFRDDGLCVHRVIHCGRGPRSRDYVVTQGDACFVPDLPVEIRRVLGPVIAFRVGEQWRPVASAAPAERARSAWGRTLGCLAASLLETDVRLARGMVRMARIRRDGPAGNVG